MQHMRVFVKMCVLWRVTTAYGVYPLSDTTRAASKEAQFTLSVESLSH